MKNLVLLSILLVLLVATILVRTEEKITSDPTPPVPQNQADTTPQSRLGNQSMSFDLNFDDLPETLELSPQCGTGGCAVRITTTQDGTITTVTEINGVQSLFLGTTTSNGWIDLVVETAGGGAPKNAYLLQFDGKTYPTHPEDGVEIATSVGLTQVF